LYDNLQLSGVYNGRRVLRVPLNYSTPGHACATLAHAAAHKARYLMPGKTLVYSITLNIWLKCRRC